MESLHAIRDTGYQRQKMTFEQWSRFPLTGFRFETTRRTYTFPDRITKPNRIASFFPPSLFVQSRRFTQAEEGGKGFCIHLHYYWLLHFKNEISPLSLHSPPPFFEWDEAEISMSLSSHQNTKCFPLFLSLSLSFRAVAIHLKFSNRSERGPLPATRIFAFEQN